jgi:hypothetical protein
MNIMALSSTPPTFNLEGFMKREDLITQIFLALVTSGEIKTGSSHAAKQVQEHLDFYDAILVELKATQPPRRKLKSKLDVSKLA